MLAPWAGAYVGLPWQPHGRTRRGVDCYGLARMVLQDIYGYQLPSYAGACDLASVDGWPSIHEAIQRGIVDWTEVARRDARIGDVVILRIAGHPLHVGVIVGTGPLELLHVRPDRDAVIERLDSPFVARRIDKVLRWTPPTR